jgi:hypothetical protein
VSTRTRPAAKHLDDHDLFRAWFPRHMLSGGDYALVEAPGGWVTVSTGGGPFWAEATPQTLDLARVLDPAAFDAGEQAVLASCMVGGWGDQAVMRAAMQTGERRFRALLNAEKAIRHIDGRLALLATPKQAAYVQGLLDSRDVPYDLRREAEYALSMVLSKADAQVFIPRLEACAKVFGRPDEGLDYDNFHDTDIPLEDTW